MPIKYMVDTCSFTQLRRTYPSDVFPSAWAKVEELAQSSKIASVDEVLEELKDQEYDEVLKWVVKQPGIFLALDKSIQEQASKILASHTDLLDLKKKKSGADPFLVAAAQIHNCTVVTEENFSNSPNHPKIPNVCKDYGIKCISLLEMLREEKLRL